MLPNQLDPLKAIKTRIERYCTSKGDAPAGHNKIKQDFFRAINTLIESDSLTADHIYQALHLIKGTGHLNELFYYGSMIWSDANSQAARLLADLYDALGRKLSNQQLEEVVKGNLDVLKTVQHYNPFVDVGDSAYQPRHYNPFGCDEQQSAPVVQHSYNPFDPGWRPESCSKPSYNPFDPGWKSESAKPNISYNPFDDPHLLFNQPNTNLDKHTSEISAPTNRERSTMRGGYAWKS